MIVGHICEDRSKSQIFAIPSISDSTYTENHKYLRFASIFLTLGGNLLRVNRFFSICVCDTHTQMRYGNAPVTTAMAMATAMVADVWVFAPTAKIRVFDDLRYGKV